MLPNSGTLPELLAGLALLDRVRAGHIAGLPADGDRTTRAAAVAELLTAAAVRQVDGLTGSEDPADAHALLELAHRADLLGGIRLTDALARLAADGSPLMRGAAGAVRVLLGHEEPRGFGDRVASWVDGACDLETRSALTARLTGLLTAAGQLLESAAPALEPLLGRVSELSDRDFLDRLPALRGGFDTLSPAARDRLLSAVEERLDERHLADTGAVDPVALAAWTRADLAAREALGAWGCCRHPGSRRPCGRRPTERPTRPPARPQPTERPTTPPAQAIGSRRLTTGSRRPTAGASCWAVAPTNCPTPPAPWRPHWTSCTAADAGGQPGRPHRCGSGGGREASYPGVREWSEELAALFGPGIREEVLAAAAATGRPDVFTELDPDTVRPSVDLLRSVLRHAGGLPRPGWPHCVHSSGAWSTR
ncbi:DUF5682 family protein [Streptomyces diastatochromogenes]|nr:DUF5682 family protein [Streptomyces diastatochromogenes]